MPFPNGVDPLSLALNARKAYLSLRDAPVEFKNLESETLVLKHLLSTVMESMKVFELSNDQAEEFGSIFKACENTATVLGAAILKYNKLGRGLGYFKTLFTQTRWVVGTVGEIKQQLMMHIMLLGIAFNVLETKRRRSELRRQTTQPQLVVLVVPVRDSVLQQLNGNCPPEMMRLITEVFSRKLIFASDRSGPTLDEFLLKFQGLQSSTTRERAEIEYSQPIGLPNVVPRSIGRVEDVSESYQSNSTYQSSVVTGLQALASRRSMPKTFPVHIKLPTGDSQTFMVQGYDTVDSLKIKIQRHYPINSEHILLEGSTELNGGLLSDWGIECSQVLRLERRLRTNGSAISPEIETATAAKRNDIKPPWLQSLLHRQRPKIREHG